MINKLLGALFAIVLFFFPAMVGAQSHKINSLKILVDASKKDNNQVDVLNKLGGLLQKSSPSAAESYTKRALGLAMDISYTTGMAMAYTNLGDLSASFHDDYLAAAKYYEKAYDIYRELYRNNAIDKWQVYRFLTENAIPTYNTLREKKKGRYRKARKYYQKLYVEFTDYLTFLATSTKDKLSSKEYELKDKDVELKAKERELLAKQAKLKAIDKRLKSAGIKLQQREIAQKLLELAKDSLSDSLFIAESIRLKLADSLVIKELEIKNNQLKLKDGALQLLKQRQKLDRLELDKAQQRTLISSITVGLVLLLVLAFVLYRNNRVQKRTNALLTVQRNQLKERNFEIEQQNEEIRNKNEQIGSKNKKITESINYAQRIQQAILPDQTLIKTVLPQSFIYYRPYQIVSGDFYWFGVVDKKVVYAAIDCTGHGVPGAFMSMVGSALLNEIVNQKQVTEPDLILKNLHIGIRDSLRQKDTLNQDGMDMAMIVIDTATQQLHFAGAKNPLVYIQQGELHTIKGDRYPIGDVVINKDERTFTKHTIALDHTTVCYMFSDGYQDQFGGPEKRKFMGKRLRQMLLDHHQLDFEKQKAVYEQTLLDWIGKGTQIDDVLLIGFKFDQHVPEQVLKLKQANSIIE
ncbi:SpoIIE family protein phosphatase [uncultured Microscilla sp.]|uniref:PP2C family protein-serine/threonine phosphatase n=1 Tax=uncultured Microscilla sp. TaxID=432653 RepID=UPI00261E7622|nr:SpoIIE family protein phosphatase [uncultured Microscilla sp.]